MPFVIFEDDLGTKKRTRKALDNMFRKRGPWKRVWDNFWKKVESDAKAFCPVRTGALWSTVKVIDIGETGDIGAPEFQKISVIMPAQDIQKDTRAIVAGDISVINPESGKPVTYAQAVHDGYMSRTGTWVAGNPFLDMSININLPYLNDLIDRYIDEEFREFSRD